MYVTDIKKSDPSFATWSRLSFNDPKASSDEIIEFINQVIAINPITHLTFDASSVLPETLGNVEALEMLSFSMSQREQAIPKGIFSTEIKKLHIYGIEQESFPAYVLPSSLESLRLEGNYLHFPTGHFPFPDLKDLTIASQNLEEIKEGTLQCEKLESLNIRAANLKNLPKSLIAPNTLSRIQVNSKFIQTIPAELGDCQNLKHLQIDAPITKGYPSFEKTQIEYFAVNSMHSERYLTSKLPSSCKQAFIQYGKVGSCEFDLSLCHNLQRVILGKLKNFPKLPAEMPKLNDIRIYEILRPIIPKELDSVCTLDYFQTSYFKIRHFPKFLLNSPNIKSIDINYASINTLPDDLDWSKCPDLETLIITGDVPLKVKSLAFTNQLPKLKLLAMPSMELENRYSLIQKKSIPLQLRNGLPGLKFHTIHARNNKIKSQSFLDFCAALGKAGLSLEDKHLFFDLLWNTSRVEELHNLSFPMFLKALNIKFKPLEKYMQRRLIREILLQHLVKSDLVQSPAAFEFDDPEKFLLAPTSKPMLDNVRIFLRSLQSENVILGLQLLKTGGVPPDMAEELLLLAKTDSNAIVRKDALDLLNTIAPPDWAELLHNKIQFYRVRFNEPDVAFVSKLKELQRKIQPELCLFFALLLRSKFALNVDLCIALDEFLFSILQEIQTPDKLIEKGAIVFINGNTSTKKTILKEKLESVGIEYATKYSPEVTHVLIGKNPKFFDLERDKINLLTENYLQKYLSEKKPDFLEEAEQQGDDSLSQSVTEFLRSEDATSVAVGLEMLKTGGVPEGLLEDLLVLNKTFPDTKIRGTAKKLLESYGPANWLPILRSRTTFKSITKESECVKRFAKLEKESNFEVCATLSLAMYKRYKMGLRYLLLRGTKGGDFHARAYSLLKEGDKLNLSKGVGYTDWRTKDNLNNYFGFTPMVKLSLTFPKNFKELLGEIKQVDLHNCKVSALPKGIMEFTELEYLNASFNGIKALPVNFKKLKNLRELDLNNNLFNEFPMRVMELKNLKRLDLRTQQKKKLEIPEEVKLAMKDCEILV